MAPVFDIVRKNEVNPNSNEFKKMEANGHNFK